jgi:hypothetical protein
MPQIVMINHAAWYNNKLMEARMKSREGSRPSHNEFYQDGDGAFSTIGKGDWSFDCQAAKDIVKADPVLMGDKKLSDLSSDFDALARYLSDWSV